MTFYHRPMSVFSLDIERLYRAKLANGFELKGIACIQYPIYCVHANILVNTKEPLEILDCAILNCMLLKEKINKSEIAKLLGVSQALMELRIGKMLEEGLLKKEKVISITEEGRNIILEGKGRRLNSKSHDFYIDGIDFQPLPSRFYDLKYSSAFFSEDTYTYYTDQSGKTQVSKPFNPSIVHEPIEKDKVLRHLFFISAEERINYQIPEGLEGVSSIDYTKMTFPLLVALLSKDGKTYREVIDGFSTNGEQDFLVLFQAKLSNRLKNLEIRLDINEDRYTNEKKFSFISNWNEIDSKSNEDRLFFIARDDLKFALSELYKISFLEDQNILTSETEIGLILTDNHFNLNNSYRANLLKHLSRGRDYKFGRFYNYGIWICFITFTTYSPFVKSMVETYEFLKEAKSRKLLEKDLLLWIKKIQGWRYILVVLEEYDLLESIDIEQNMSKQ